MEFNSQKFASPEAQEEFFRRCEGLDSDYVKELCANLGLKSNYLDVVVNTFDLSVQHQGYLEEYRRELKRLQGLPIDEPAPRGRPKKTVVEKLTEATGYERAKADWRIAKLAEENGCKEADEWAAAQWEQIKKMRDDRKAQLRNDVRAKRAVMDAARKV